MTSDEVELLLESEGWPAERLDPNTWRSGFRAEGAAPFRFFVRLTSNWLCLTIVPFVSVPADDMDALPLYRRLLEPNRDITLAKLAVDKRDVILTVELPIENLQTSQLKDGLDALVFYANTYVAELSALGKA